ncbi:redoxin domain-containing protein [Exiguobacterium sp. SH3S2]|uniref:redoxin domain-containing protein n=1 Tax=unclassified Exiguobacterium TaxID=2644629 RepID=UPI0008B8F58A|nr:MULTISPECIES: redoxin domain-containing protein [unclassified Exiguobacterium]OGX80366.1 alkyl hydroperoxide reductase [Exiguobacterium sp. SH31]TCI25176.1 redoxin domain-containing protein [Exiguobacterium sp. SH5S4]TCI39712.1 redoxin domain-containing protein [Exiguobacterium sp. SH4S7]TCI46371.1 redoxin domain-containing protein [Exiguobacterium sp. SH3S3]TCI47596.1 redoxin domain-containing protein [Exiguobacterium sp. SH5S32]
MTKETKQGDRMNQAMAHKKKRSFWRLMIMTMVLFAGAVVIMQLIEQAGNDGRVEAGDDAPNFKLVSLDGATMVERETYDGKGMLLNFWGTFCEPCEKEMPVVQDNYATLQNMGVDFWAVNVGETPLRVDNFINDLGVELDYPILMDTRSEVEKAYGIYNLPVTFVIDADGKVIEKYEGELTKEKLLELAEKSL